MSVDNWSMCMSHPQDKASPVQQGQPEVEDFLGLPTDEESYNELKALFAFGRPTTSGGHFYVSDSFPGRITVACVKQRDISSPQTRQIRRT
jgi:hypothetical protein